MISGILWMVHQSALEAIPDKKARVAFWVPVLKACWEDGTETDWLEGEDAVVRAAARKAAKS